MYEFEKNLNIIKEDSITKKEEYKYKLLEMKTDLAVLDEEIKRKEKERKDKNEEYIEYLKNYTSLEASSLKRFCRNDCFFINSKLYALIITKYLNIISADNYKVSTIYDISGMLSVVDYRTKIIYREKDFDLLKTKESQNEAIENGSVILLSREVDTLSKSQNINISQIIPDLNINLNSDGVTDYAKISTLFPYYDEIVQITKYLVNEKQIGNMTRPISIKDINLIIDDFFNYKNQMQRVRKEETI